MAPSAMSARAAGLLLVSALAAGVHGLEQAYCSNENTGADFQGTTDIYNSNGACKTQCQNGGYALAIVQWKSCWCSNYLPADQSSVGSCDHQCPGYPYENCGNQDNGMYGYVQLAQPSGTAGASSSSAQETSTSEYSSPSEESSTPPPPPSSTAPPPTSSTAPSPTETSYAPPPSTTSTSTPEPTPIPSSTSSEPRSTRPPPTHSPTPVVNTRVITVSGQQVTQTVTSTPFYNPGSDEQDQQISRSGLSGGAIAGIVIGTLVGLAALLLAAFLLWRHKKQQDDENAAPGNKPPKRTTSVLSKTGLLSRATARPTSMAENNYDDGYGSVRHSMLLGGGAGASVEPSSPLGGSQSNVSSTRRHSKPLVYDQRLNPSALFANADANGSRVSMQDTQDYSRPLGIANPDLRASFDSRNDER